MISDLGASQGTDNDALRIDCLFLSPAIPIKVLLFNARSMIMEKPYCGVAVTAAGPAAVLLTSISQLDHTASACQQQR